VLLNDEALVLVVSVVHGAAAEVDSQCRAAANDSDSQSAPCPRDPFFGSGDKQTLFSRVCVGPN